jgi:hypothetical protein
VTKSELLSRLDCREMDLRGLINDLLTDVQLMPGDDQFRALRNVCDLVEVAAEKVKQAALKTKEMGDW